MALTRARAKLVTYKSDLPESSVQNLHDVLTEVASSSGVALANNKENALRASGIKGDLKSSIYKVGDTYIVNRHLGGDNWLETTLTNSGQVSGQDTPWKVTRQKVYEALGWLTGKDATEGGTWATYNSGSNIYVGHQVKQSNSAGNTLTWTETFGGDLAVCFTGDTDGGIVEVTIDGGSPIDVDTYSATANDYRQLTTVATGLSEESHTIVITSTSRKNASSSGTQANITGLRISNSPIAPYSALFQAKPWRPNTTARAYEEVQGPTGLYYYTVAGGTTGSTPPTHTTGTVSDGGVSWAITASTSFSEKSCLIQATGSELEYAYEVIPTGESVPQDVGGNLHGNEVVTGIRVLIDANEVFVTEEHTVGYMVTLRQELLDYYGDYATKTDVASVVQVHEFDTDSMRVKYDMAFVTDAQIGYFYSCMWPFLTYSASGYVKQFAEMSTPRASISLADYEGDSTNPIVGREADYWMEAKGRAYVEAGSAGVPTSDNGTIGITIGLKADIDGVNNYTYSSVKAGMAANANSGNYTGYSSWLSKMYFMRASSASRESVSSGQTISNQATYYVKLSDNNIDVSSL